jgi:carbon-monoxide dehydrogenase small subunit
MLISCVVNGRDREVEVEPHELLLDVIRERLGLTGAKRSCDVQVCGACTVLIDGLPVSSCSTLAVEADGANIETIEGLAQDGTLSTVQAAFVAEGALQCGFCTPGMVMMVESLLRDHPAASREEAAEYLEGTLCRCTGYVKILDAIQRAQGALPEGGAGA